MVWEVWCPLSFELNKTSFIFAFKAKVLLCFNTRRAEMFLRKTVVLLLMLGFMTLIVSACQRVPVEKYSMVFFSLSKSQIL